MQQTEHYSKIIEEAGNDQKLLFKVANSLKDKTEIRTLPDHTDTLQLANEYNNYYLTKIDKLWKFLSQKIEQKSNMTNSLGRN